MRFPSLHTEVKKRLCSQSRRQRSLSTCYFYSRKDFIEQRVHEWDLCEIDLGVHTWFVLWISPQIDFRTTFSIKIMFPLSASFLGLPIALGILEAFLAREEWTLECLP